MKTKFIIAVRTLAVIACAILWIGGGMYLQHKTGYQNDHDMRNGDISPYAEEHKMKYGDEFLVFCFVVTVFCLVAGQKERR